MCKTVNFTPILSKHQSGHNSLLPQAPGSRRPDLFPTESPEPRAADQKVLHVYLCGYEWLAASHLEGPCTLGAQQRPREGLAGGQGAVGRSPVG